VWEIACSCRLLGETFLLPAPLPAGPSSEVRNLSRAILRRDLRPTILLDEVGHFLCRAETNCAAQPTHWGYHLWLYFVADGGPLLAHRRKTSVAGASREFVPNVLCFLPKSFRWQLGRAWLTPLGGPLACQFSIAGAKACRRNSRDTSAAGKVALERSVRRSVSFASRTTPRGRHRQRSQGLPGRAERDPRPRPLEAAAGSGRNLAGDQAMPENRARPAALALSGEKPDAMRSSLGGGAPFGPTFERCRVLGRGTSWKARTYGARLSGTGRATWTRQ